MTYIFETNLVKTKQIYIALSKIFGIGLNQSKFICKKLGFQHNYKIQQLSNKQLEKIIYIIENDPIKINADLTYTTKYNIQNLLTLKTYRGLRLKKGLPVRGQRTHTNANTAKKIKR